MQDIKLPVVKFESGNNTKRSKLAYYNNLGEIEASK